MKISIAPLLLAAGIASFAAHAQDAPVTETTAKPELEQCYLKGISEQLRCGTLQVPENYDKPDGKTIGIHFAVLPAVRESKQADPLLILAGGPGQAATELANMISRTFQSVRQQRDILLIDQRGTGQSNPLSCEMSHVEELVKADDAIDLANMAENCLAKFDDTDLTQYHTVNAIRDFEAVREALGYEQVNLYGGSYGTRAGLVYMREAPESVRAAVLDAVAPVQVVVGPFGLHGAESFTQLINRCGGSEACSAAFPNIGDTYTPFMQQLEIDPVPLTVRDPLSNEPIDILVTAGRFSSVMRVGLYHPTTRQMLPYVISRTAAGDYVPLTGLLGSTMAQSELYMGLTLSVLCSEDLPRVTPELLAADGDNTFIGSRTGDAFIEMCSVWPKEQRPDEWFEPIQSDIPTLLLSGELDPVTPPAWGELAAQTLDNSRHLVAPQGAHTIVGHTCANKLASEFIKDLDLAALDPKCLAEQRPQPFILNSNGKGL